MEGNLKLDCLCWYPLSSYPSGQNLQKKTGRSAFLLIRRSKYSAVLSKTHSYRLLLIQCRVVKNTLLQTAFSAIFAHCDL